MCFSSWIHLEGFWPFPQKAGPFFPSGAYGDVRLRKIVFRTIYQHDHEFCLRYLCQRALPLRLSDARPLGQLVRLLPWHWLLIQFKYWLIQFVFFYYKFSTLWIDFLGEVKETESSPKCTNRALCHSDNSGASLFYEEEQKDGIGERRGGWFNYRHSFLCGVYVCTESANHWWDSNEKWEVLTELWGGRYL